MSYLQREVIDINNPVSLKLLRDLTASLSSQAGEELANFFWNSSEDLVPSPIQSFAKAENDFDNCKRKTTYDYLTNPCGN